MTSSSARTVPATSVPTQYPTPGFYAVRVTLTFDDGSTVERVYVRGPVRLSRDSFGRFALGDLIALTAVDATITAWEVDPDLDEATVLSEHPNLRY